ncbi:glycoside hydrolase family 13 protein [Lyngbya sp. PCC 8106]|uniref:glycoside hydrolase family 13 protein n=1 Tax=Lyngbya sp. (strain PCC 8106) TaxID=313612 RepID=UPI0000EAB143|nr:glycoside hydrolase family 13 protein [Lyngbya sp. PCC 8106]EAW39218.1 Alpha amylase, catalytic region [Lyngbya sp. PCC 8106]
MDIQTPDWVKHAVFYQIFPDRFAKSEKSHYQFLIKPNWEEWDAPPTPQGYKGGDLWGVIEKLDYIQDLGINAIYFTPIFQSACNHRYHTHDYYQVDPILGGNQALKELLDAAHQRNIKIVLDGVFNHASRGFFFFNDILENGSNSPWLNWFKIQDWPLSAYDGNQPANYVSWAGNRALPEFNHDNPEVREYIMRIAEYWLKFGIDGWRLDVPFEIKTPGFWQEFRERVKIVNPEAYIVGEVWTDSRPWLDGTQFDGVMNYLFTAPTLAFTGGDRVRMELVEEPSYFPYPALSAREYATQIYELLNLYPWEIQLTQLNLLDSHDTARVLSIVDGDKASVELSTLLLLTFPGAPSIYYGDEVGLPGELDPDSRRGFPFQKDWDEPTLNYHKQLIAIRHQYPALRTGGYQILFAEGLVYVFARISEDQEVIVAVNSGIESANITVQADSLKSRPENLLYGEAELSWEGDKLTLNIPERSGCILAVNS